MRQGRQCSGQWPMVHSTMLTIGHYLTWMINKRMNRISYKFLSNFNLHATQRTDGHGNVEVISCQKSFIATSSVQIFIFDRLFGSISEVVCLSLFTSLVLHPYFNPPCSKSVYSKHLDFFVTDTSQSKW